MPSTERFEFEQRGSTWTCKYRDTAAWPLMLIARRVYYGTGRVLATLTLARQVEGSKSVIILTEHVDLLTGTRRKGFSKEAGHRLKDQGSGAEDGYEVAVGSMLDALLERLLGAQNEIDIVSATDIEIPKDLTPPYALWPLVPASRPGMLVGLSGQGKSGLAMVGGLSTVTGKTILSRIEPRMQGPVMYIGQEENAEQWAARLEMLCRGLQIDRPKHYWYVRLKGGSLLESAEMLAEQAASRKVVLMIVDSAQATWGGGEDAVREYASRWYNAVEQLGVPVQIIEHPNLASTRDTKRGSAELFAAGSSVKRDRVGHAWSLRSTALPVREGHPMRYHVTLTDEKRNYVAQQQKIFYEVIVHGYEWMQYQESEELTASTIVESGSKIDDSLASFMRAPDEAHEEYGYTVAELADRLKQKDDRRIRQSVSGEFWRPANWNSSIQYRFTQVEGSGTDRVRNPQRFILETEAKEDDGFQFSTAPGDPDEIS